MAANGEAENVAGSVGKERSGEWKAEQGATITGEGKRIFVGKRKTTGVKPGRGETWNLKPGNVGGKKEKSRKEDARDRARCGVVACDVRVTFT